MLSPCAEDALYGVRIDGEGLGRDGSGDEDDGSGGAPKPAGSPSAFGVALVVAAGVSPYGEGEADGANDPESEEAIDGDGGGEVAEFHDAPAFSATWCERLLKVHARHFDQRLVAAANCFERRRRSREEAGRRTFHAERGKGVLHIADECAVALIACKETRHRPVHAGNALCKVHADCAKTRRTA
jgi:hypothetical protein